MTFRLKRMVREPLVPAALMWRLVAINTLLLAVVAIAVLALHLRRNSLRQSAVPVQGHVSLSFIGFTTNELHGEDYYYCARIRMTNTGRDAISYSEEGGPVYATRRYDRSGWRSAKWRDIVSGVSCANGVTTGYVEPLQSTTFEALLGIPPSGQYQVTLSYSDGKGTLHTAATEIFQFPSAGP
jgi:hypothetical protein